MSSFWLLLILYWLTLMLWTYIAFKSIIIKHRVILVWQLSVVAAFTLQWILCLCSQTRAISVVVWLVLTYLVLYMTVIRARIRKAAGMG
jgi:hypothetical protein